MAVQLSLALPQRRNANLGNPGYVFQNKLICQQKPRQIYLIVQHFRFTRQRMQLTDRECDPDELLGRYWT